MQLFNISQARKRADWGDAHNAQPQFYEKPDGGLFGAIAVTEGTKTILPRNPQLKYNVDGKPVSEWRLVLVSTTKSAVIGDSDYCSALERIEPYSLDDNQDAVLIKELSLAELECLRG